MGYRIFKTTYTDRKGKTREAAKWYIEFKDANETTRRLPAFTSKAASEEFGRNLVKLVEYHRATAGQTDPALHRWLADLPQRTRAKLAEIGLLSPERAAVRKPLDEHLDDWARSLRAKGNSPKHVKLVTGRARRVFAGCGFTFYPDISASKVEAYLADLREDAAAEQGISAQTFTFYVKTIKQFCAWMTRDKRATESPVAHLDGLNVQVDRRHDRRALLPEQLTTVLKGARESERAYRGLTGEDRFVLYLTACGSGFRAGELSVLEPENFDLASVPPTVTLPARFTKNKKPVTQPLPSEVANVLRDYLKGRTPGQRVWAGTWWEKAAEMLKGDLETVGIPYVVDGPNGPLFADFHSLRHAYVSGLARGGVSPKHAQELARHSDIRLTMQRYTHATLCDLGAAVDSLPSIVPGKSRPERQALRATGTEDARGGESVLAFCLALPGGQMGTLVDSGGRTAEKRLAAETPENKGKTSISAEKSDYARRGSNPQPAVPKTAALSS